MFPPIVVTSQYDGTSTLTKLFRYQNNGKSRTGRKRPKADDYKDLEIPAPKRGPWKFRKEVNEPISNHNEGTNDLIEGEKPSEVVVEKINEIPDIIPEIIIPSSKIACNLCGTIVNKKSLVAHKKSVKCQKLRKSIPASTDTRTYITQSNIRRTRSNKCSSPLIK